ncbi:MAG: hypothetical protein JNL06_00620 [Alphaproteobacteria bacterium]|nr:hypothetical protein [Alphaproteobacteria bacterium]
MGREAKVEYADAKERALVKVHLDSAALELTGGKKLRLPLANVKSATVDGDLLKIAAGGTKFSLALGAKEAEAWRKKILNPPSLADKLGFKPDKSIAVIGEVPPEIAAAAKTAKVAAAAAKLPKTIAADIAALMLAPGKEEQLIVASAKALAPASALWLVYEKGRAVNGDHVIALARKAGLKDTKVARVSDTHAALRFIKGGN